MDRGKRFSSKVAAGEDAGPAIVGALAEAEAFAGEAGLNEATRRRLLVVVEELVCNCARHGGAGGPVEITLTLETTPGGVSIGLVDDGPAFDPTASRDFAGPHDTTGGGVGLELVRAWAENFIYSREDGRNRVSLLLACERLPGA